MLEAHQLQDVLGQPESGAALAAEGEKFAGDVLEIGAVGAAFGHKGFFGGHPLLGGGVARGLRVAALDKAVDVVAH